MLDFLNNINDKVVTQYSFWEEVSNINLEEIRMKLKKYLEDIDEEIFNSQFRKNEKYIPKGFVNRSIITIFGCISFRRRRYLFKNANQKIENVYLLDNKLQINRYSRLTAHLQLKILSLIAQGKRYQDILDCFPAINISLMTISNIMKKFDLESYCQNIQTKIKPITIKEKLYINIDETYITLKTEKGNEKHRIRLVNFHGGYDESGITKRKKLFNKRSFAILTKINEPIDINDFVQQINHNGHKFYSNYDDAIKIIGGDGAPWIKKTALLINKAIFILDKFHLVRTVRRTILCKKTKKWIDIFEHATKLINNGQVFALILLLEQIQKEKEAQKYNYRFKKCINYIKVNSKAISNYNLPWVIGCSAESNISYLIKWLSSYGSKVFNVKIYRNMLAVSLAKHNNININKIIQENYQWNKIIY